jgi:hypothetical protein
LDNGREWRVRFDVSERVMAGFVGGSILLSQDALLFVYNAGRHRFTANDVGWFAKDGSRHQAHPETPQTAEPGSEEIRYTAEACAIVKLADDHAGMAGAYVHIAGEQRAREFGPPAGWMGQVRAMCALPKTTSW